MHFNYIKNTLERKHPLKKEQLKLLKDLKTNWIFKSLKQNQTLINFNVEFEFKRFFHQKIAETFFPLIENKMIESFKDRADEILN